MSFVGPLLNNILTVFIPTVILVIISHMARHLEENYVDMVIQVNLTVILVLATLYVFISEISSIHSFFFSFIGISQSLPTTSYVKIIDIWMIATMSFPFIEVFLHTYKEMLRTKMMTNAKVSPMIRKHEKQFEQKMKFCHLFSDWILPMTSLLFLGCFCILGLVNYNWPHIMQGDTDMACIRHDTR